MQRNFRIALANNFYSEPVHLSQYDTNYNIVFEVMEKTSKAPINGMTAYFEGTRCDGLSFRYSGTASDNYVSFSIDTALTAVSGRHTGEIVLYDGSGLWFGSANVQILVEKAARPDNAIDADVEEARSIAEQIQEIVDTAAETAVANWLDEHPEATTTVQDGAVTEAKLSDALKLKTIKDYVTPEMYGAKGDGITDDAQAITMASNNGAINGGGKTYYIGSSCAIKNDLYNCKFLINKEITITAQKNGLHISNCEFLDDDYYPSTGRGKWMITVVSSDKVIISNCYFHHGVSALYINRCTNMIIRNCIFADLRQLNTAGGNGYGIACIETKKLSVVGNVFYNVARHSVYISHDGDSSYNEDIIIKNNIFEWDDNVVGNTTGYELTVNIRPSKRVYIENNIFLNMYGIMSVDKQDIKVDGATVFACSEDIFIRYNHGTFQLSPRSRDSGMFYFTTNAGHNSPCKNVIIEGNDFLIEKNGFVTANSIDGLSIINNKIRYTEVTSAAVIISCPYPNDDSDFKNFKIIGNDIECSALFEVKTIGKSINDLIISNNHLYLSNYFGSVPNGTTFNNFELTNNVGTHSSERCYFSSSVVSNIILGGNILDKRVTLYLNATNVTSTDPCLKGYGYNSSNPTGVLVGSIHIWDNGQTYIMDATGTWKQLFTDLATTSSAGAMSAQDKSRLDDVYADYSSALTALGVI